MGGVMAGNTCSFQKESQNLQKGYMYIATLQSRESWKC